MQLEVKLSIVKSLGPVWLPDANVFGLTFCLCVPLTSTMRLMVHLQPLRGQKKKKDREHR